MEFKENSRSLQALVKQMLLLAENVDMIFYSSILTVLLLFFLPLAVADAKDYVPSNDLEATYEDILQGLLDRGDMIVSKDKGSIVALYRFNNDIVNEFLFSMDRLQKVVTFVSDQSLVTSLMELDKNFRRYGAPVEVVPVGDDWGQGFMMIWQRSGERYSYTVTDLPLDHDAHLKTQVIVWEVIDSKTEDPQRQELDHL